MIAALVAQLFLSPVSPVLSASTYNLNGASVDAEPNSFLVPGSSGSTASNGQYVINSSILPGQYTVTASDRGYLDGVQTATVNSTSDVDNMNFNLARSGILWGRVLGSDGRPVVGAEVSLINNGNGPGTSDVFTDSNGMYYFYDGVATGNYSAQVDFTFSFSTIAQLLEYYGNATAFNFPYVDAPYLTNGYVGATSSAVLTTAGGVTQVPDLILPMSGVITGKVTDGQGNPLANIPIQAKAVNNDYSLYVLTDSNGNYRVSYDVVSDNYTVTADTYGYVSSTGSVIATQTGTANLNLAISRSAGLSGHVTRTSDHKAIPNAIVELQGVTTHDFGYGITDVNGYYSAFTGLETDNYSVIVLLGSFPLYQGSVLLTSGQNSTQDFSGNAFFVTGTVRASSTSGPGISSAYVSGSFIPYGFPFAGATDSNGAYTLAVAVPTSLGGIQAGLNLTASATGYISSSALSNVTIGNDISQNFVLLPTSTAGSSATIEGTVTGGTGPELPAQMFWWHSGNYLVGLNSTSDIQIIFATPANSTLDIYAEGPEGTHGTTTVWLPDSQFKGPFVATSYPGPNPTIVSQSDNGTYYQVNLTYSHSFHLITLMGSTPVPEFPGVALVAALGSAVAVALLYERRLRMPSLAAV